MSNDLKPGMDQYPTSIRSHQARNTIVEMCSRCPHSTFSPASSSLPCKSKPFKKWISHCPLPPGSGGRGGGGVTNKSWSSFIAEHICLAFLKIFLTWRLVIALYWCCTCSKILHFLAHSISAMYAKWKFKVYDLFSFSFLNLFFILRNYFFLCKRS